MGHIRSLASILFIKSGLHCGRFAPLHNPQFHFIKSPPDLIWVRPTLIMTEGHNFNYLSLKLLNNAF